ncbi:MAG: hypothetical protein ACI4JC_02950 [Faecalibacterium sp.]
MKRSALSVVLIILCTICLCGCCIQHDWIAATCTAPETCSKCGKTRGEAVGHSWTEATCTSPKTCTVCGTTEGRKLTHVFGPWSDADVFYSLAQKISTRKCTLCGTMESKTVPITRLHDGSKFFISPDDLIIRMKAELRSMEGSTYEAQAGTIGNNNTLVAGIRDSSTTHAAFGFVGLDGEFLTSRDKSKENSFQSILGRIYDTDGFVPSLLSLILSCDPSLTFNEAKEVAINLLSNSEVTKNGIEYLFYQEDRYTFVVGVTLS